MDEINQKLAALRDKYPDKDSLEILADWEKQAKISVMTANLQENDAIKIIILNYQKELESLNKILTEDESLFKDDDGRLLGQTIHARKKWCKRFLQIFTIARSQADNATSKLDTILEE